MVGFIIVVTISIASAFVVAKRKKAFARIYLGTVLRLCYEDLRLHLVRVLQLNAHMGY